MINFSKKILISTISFLLALMSISCTKYSDKKYIYIPTIKLESNGNTIYPTYYEDGFDFNYNNLPTLTLSSNQDTLLISLSDDFNETFKLEEDYYGNTEINMQTYELKKDKDNIVLFTISNSSTIEDAMAFYFFKNNEVTYVFKVIFQSHS